MKGITTIHVSRDDAPKSVLVGFYGTHGGAKEWREIVDSFVTVVSQEAEASGERAGWQPPGRLLGKGGKLRMSRALCAIAYAKWRRLPLVRAARKAGELELEVAGDALPKALIKKARQLVQNEAAET